MGRLELESLGDALADMGISLIQEGNEPAGLAALEGAGHALAAARGAWR